MTAVSATAPTARRAIVVGLILASLAAGITISVQTSLNGHVNVLLDSPVLAMWVNHMSALTISVIVALAMGAIPRSVRQLRARRGQVRWWYFLGGVLGVGGVLSIITATPLVGVVVVGVSITLGQLAGSIIADSGSLSPGGRKPLTGLRIAGVAVAVVAVGAGALGRLELESGWVIVFVVVGGIMIALQQAFNGWLVVVTGEFAVMSTINFGISLIVTSIALVATASVLPMHFDAIPWWAPAGGIISAIVGVISALAIRHVGVLTVVLCIAAGQAIGGIVMDLLLPVDAAGLTIGSIVGAVLAVIAVSLAGLGGMSRRRRPGAETDAEAADDVASASMPVDIP